MSANASDAGSADAMNELAAVLIRERDYQAAETLLRRAQTGAAAATAVRVTNNLAALAAMRGDVTTAESLYRSALALADSSPEYESARRAIESNLQDLRAPR
jgi:Flp pilus assembly protein TadD